MANTKRTSTDNIFGNKGTVRPRQKTGALESSQEVMSINDKFDEIPKDSEKEIVTAETQKKEESPAQPVSSSKSSSSSSKKNKKDDEPDAYLDESVNIMLDMIQAFDK